MATKTRRGTTSAPLKNYRSEASLSSIMEAIRRTLAEGGARRIALAYVSPHYSEPGETSEITFSLPVGDQLATFRLPVRQEAVGLLLKESCRVAGRSCPQGAAFTEQVERVAWANIRDWLSAQVALIRTKMVKPEEVFLPYLLIEGYPKPLTHFEVFEREILAVPTPEQRGHVRITEAGR